MGFEVFEHHGAYGAGEGAAEQAMVDPTGLKLIFELHA